MREHITNSPSQTRKIAEILAKKILRTPLEKKALILRLEGDLGGGKTTFLQGFAKGLGIKEKILSPTFVIMKKYKIPTGLMGKFQSFYHIDCYRIKKQKEILNLEFKEIISNPKNIIAIEWAEKIKKMLPQDAFSIKFDFLSKNKRKIKLSEVRPRTALFRFFCRLVINWL